MKILGIDPGYDRLGIAIIETTKPKETVLYSECFKTDRKDVHAERLRNVGDRIREIIQKYEPGEVAIEGLLFSTNKKTALAVGEARGIILAEVARASVPLFEYAPVTIKLAVTGYGKSDKSAVMKLVPKLALFTKEVTQDDEMDAVAVALTHSAMRGFPQKK